MLGRICADEQAQIQDFDTFDEGYGAFCKTFQNKTGLLWSERQESAAEDCYHFVGHNMFNMDEHYVSSIDDASENNPKWQYWWRMVSMARLTR